jgi:hypothetical protein
VAMSAVAWAKAGDPSGLPVSAAGKASSRQISESLSIHWRKVRERCARC